MRFRESWMLTLSILLLAGCGSGGADASKERLKQMAGGTLKELVPVSGKVLVDGEAKKGVSLFLHRVDAAKKEAPIADCRTNNEGTYCWSTHAPCDGLEPGEYRVTFRYVPKLKRNESNEVSDDQFKGKYGDHTKSQYKLSVVKGTPQTGVDYELKTK